MQNESYEYEHLEPSTISVRPGEGFPMASFGIAKDPDAEARKKRGLFFGVGVAVFIAVAGLMLSRSSSEPVAKQKEKSQEEKPAAAAAPPPPPAASVLPAPAASEKPKQEEEKKAPDAKDGPEDKKTKGKGHRRHAKSKSAD